MIAWAIAIRLAIAYAITKKLITRISSNPVILSYDWS